MSSYKQYLIDLFENQVKKYALAAAQLKITNNNIQHLSDLANLPDFTADFIQEVKLISTSPSMSTRSTLLIQPSNVSSVMKESSADDNKTGNRTTSGGEVDSTFVNDDFDENVIMELMDETFAESQVNDLQLACSLPTSPPKPAATCCTHFVKCEPGTYQFILMVDNAVKLSDSDLWMTLDSQRMRLERTSLYGPQLIWIGQDGENNLVLNHFAIYVSYSTLAKNYQQSNWIGYKNKLIGCKIPKKTIFVQGNRESLGTLNVDKLDQRARAELASLRCLNMFQIKISNTKEEFLRTLALFNQKIYENNTPRTLVGHDQRHFETLLTNPQQQQSQSVNCINCIHLSEMMKYFL